MKHDADEIWKSNYRRAAKRIIREKSLRLVPLILLRYWWSIKVFYVNALISAFVPLTFEQNIIVFARQCDHVSRDDESHRHLEVWDCWFFFAQFFTQFLERLHLLPVIFGDCSSYYPDLIWGAVVPCLDGLKQVFFKKRKKKINPDARLSLVSINL